jgi:hypothetical protein
LERWPSRFTWKSPKISPAADPSGVTHAALEGVRSGKFTVSQARRLFGIGSQYEMDGFLKAHGVFLNLTLDDVRKDRETALAFSR